MNKPDFEEHFLRATSACVALASRHVIEVLPDTLRFQVFFNHPLSRTGATSSLYDTLEKYEFGSYLREEQVVDLLWHDDLVPMWINIKVSCTTPLHTVIELLCSSTLSKMDFHKTRVIDLFPPFHIVAPPTPPGWKQGDMLSLFYKSKCFTMQEYAYICTFPDRVSTLELYGDQFADGCFDGSVIFNHLTVLHLYSTNLWKRPSRAAVSLPSVQYCSAVLDNRTEMEFDFIPTLSSLKGLHLSHLPGKLVSVWELLQRYHHLSQLGLHVNGDFVLDCFPEMGNLTSLSLSAVGRLDISDVSGLHTLEHLVINSMFASDQMIASMIRSLPQLGGLVLLKTEAAEETVEAILAHESIRFIDLVGANRGQELRNLIVLERPELTVKAGYIGQ